VEVPINPSWELAVSSLENRRHKDPLKHVEVVAVTDQARVDEASGPAGQRATVFVPDGGAGHFLKQLEKYALATPKKTGERRHENLYDRIAQVRLATLRAMWTDRDDAYPDSDEEVIWWEIWLHRTDGDELARLHEYAAMAEIRLSERRIQFDDRIVTLACGSARQLSASLDVLGDLAEVRRAKETAAFFTEESTKDQAEWVDNLTDRTQHPTKDAPSVCVLDTGVNRNHPLLAPALASDDCHAIDPTWGTHDNGGGPQMEGHGTEMAGLALYGDLVPALASNTPVQLHHGLESVKILPPSGANDPDLYGALTAEAVSRPEIQAPARRRVFAMAVTTTDTRDDGQPTSWSSAIDALAAGRSFDPSSKGLVYVDDDAATPRLFVVSAGNVDPGALEFAHLDRSDTEPVHDPAQAWNALTVGAYTDKVILTDPNLKGWCPLAAPGDLSPWSTTSMTFARQWPSKPDILMEGGNVVHDGANTILPCDDLCLLTTNYKPAEKIFVQTWATSAATAQAARICASVSAAYPSLSPEAIRGLVVHSAEWTPLMRARFDAANGKRARALLARRYGFGVPSLSRASRSADDAVTLLVQDSIHPFIEGKMREIHLHDLPWPRAALASLGGIDVRLRVTLSYFVEPNPGRRGWQTKHRYQSHGLRFEVKRPTESAEHFHKRLNKAALEEDADRSKVDGTDD